MRRIIINTLARIGYRDVVEAEHGMAGLEKLGQGGVEIDHYSTGTCLRWTAWSSCRRCGGKIPSIPILLVTTNSAKDDIVQALQAGVNNYVVKPFTPETLKGEDRNALGLRWTGLSRQQERRAKMTRKEIPRK